MYQVYDTARVGAIYHETWDVSSVNRFDRPKSLRRISNQLGKEYLNCLFCITWQIEAIAGEIIRRTLHYLATILYSLLLLTINISKIRLHFLNHFISIHITKLLRIIKTFLRITMLFLYSTSRRLYYFTLKTETSNIFYKILT